MKKFKTGAETPFVNFMDRLQKEVNTLKESLDTSKEIIGIGIGAPNANSYSGQMEHPPNFRWGDYIPAFSSFRKTPSREIRRILNDIFDSFKGTKL